MPSAAGGEASIASRPPSSSAWRRAPSPLLGHGRMLGRVLFLGAVAALGDAGLEGLHQIDDAGLRRLGGRGGDLLPVHLALDLLEHALPHGVAEILGAELLHRALLDELARQGELGVLERDICARHLAGAADVAVIVELLHREDVAHRADQDQVLLAARGILTERGPAGVGQRRDQQAVRPLAALAGTEIVDLLQEDPVHRGERHELGDVDGIAGLLVERLDSSAEKRTYWSLANS